MQTGTLVGVRANSICVECAVRTQGLEAGSAHGVARASLLTRIIPRSYYLNDLKSLIYS